MNAFTSGLIVSEKAVKTARKRFRKLREANKILFLLIIYVFQLNNTAYIIRL